MHDMEKSHGLLVSHEYKAFDLKGLDDSQDPLRRVNEVHARLKASYTPTTALAGTRSRGCSISSTLCQIPRLNLF